MDATSLRAGEPASFSALVKRHRLAAGLSQEALAERAGLSARAISAYERGLRQAPYRDTVRLLAQALGLSPEDTASLDATVSRRRRAATVRRADAAASPGTSEPALTNLPLHLTSFVGHQGELAEIERLLADARLVTLTGTGGCGKTRLALHVAGRMLGRFADGVWVAELAPLTEPSLVPQAVASAVGVREEPEQPLLGTLVAALRARRLLLVLDNCEHLLDACARLADALLRACPDLRILATSREALGITGEMRWRVRSLTVPALGRLPPLDRLPHYEAVQLFLDRAQAAQPGFGLSRQNAPAVAQICRRLDGIPLAIELAATRLRVVTAEQIAARLDDRFRLLTGGSRTVLPRQQTLQATFDWSYQLLSEAERVFLRRLAVFAGSWTLEAAEAIAGPAALDLLTALVDKSWVIADAQGGEERYRLIESIRQYAGEKLLESGEGQAVRARYRAWYRALVERAEPELSGPWQRLWLDRLERDHDNLRAVLEGSLAEPAFLAEGIRLAAALLRLWVVRGYLGEGRQLLTSLLGSAPADPALRRSAAWMAALYAAGFAAYFQGDFTGMGIVAGEWLAVSRALGDERSIWLALDMLARQAMNQGDYPRARDLFVGELAAMRRRGDRFGIASALIGLGILVRLQGDHERAVALCEECIAVSREAGDVWFIGQALANLGLARYEQGQYGVARRQFAEALAARRELHDRSGIAWSLVNLGDVEQAQGKSAAARGRLEESLTLLRELGDRAGTADALASLGRVAQAQGRLAEARTCYVESLTLRRELRQRLALPGLLESLAGLAAAEGREAQALTLVGAAAALRGALGAPRSPADREKVERWEGPARAALGQAAAAAWAEGRAMTPEQAEAYALSVAAAQSASANGGLPAPVPTPSSRIAAAPG